MSKEGIENARHELLLFHLPPPIGWMALTAAELLVAQSRAVDLLPFAGARHVVRDAPALRGPRLLTAAEAAGVLSVDAPWLLRQAREGRIAHVRLGKYVRFDPDAIIGQCTKQPILGRDTRIG